MAISALDRDMRDLASTKGKNFAYLVHSYSYRRDQLSEKHLKKHSPVEILCKLNERVTKRAGMAEIALTWKSLCSLAKELLEVRKHLKEAT